MDGGAKPSPDRRRDRDPREARGRYYDPRFKAMAVKVLAGDHYVTDSGNEMAVSVLGSCVSACMRDPVAGVGGMNHFMFPETGRRARTGDAAMRYGQHAMETLINSVMKRGGRRDRLEVKVFGGGNVIQTSTRVGDSNRDFVLSFLEREGIPVAVRDLGGEMPRRVHYFPRTGKVYRLFLRRQNDAEVFREELRLRDRLLRKRIEGEVELFGEAAR